MNAEEVKAKAKDRGEMLADAANDGSVVLGGMTILERYAIEMMPVAAGVVERRQIARAISEYVTGMRAGLTPTPPLNAARFALGNLEEHVDEIADQAVIMADALLRRLAQ